MIGVRLLEINMQKRSILAVTGIRSDYDILSSVFAEIKKRESLSLKLIVTGAHLSKAHGYTLNEIKKDGLSIIAQIESLLSADTLSSRVKSLAIQLQSLVDVISNAKPDLLLVLGDREEAINVALAGSYLNIPVVHFCGGDRVIGNVDDNIRHAVTKLAHIHFPSNEDSAKRIASLGEQSFRIYNVGNPGLDRLLQTPTIPLSEVWSNFGFDVGDEENYIVIIQHVISSESDFGYEQMLITLSAVKELGVKAVVVYPNSDAGSQGLINAIDEFKSTPNIFMIKNIPRLEFVNILRSAACLVGNSSAGILEAPILKLPVVNIGNRQKGRLHAENVQFVSHDVMAIKAAISKALYDSDYKKIVQNCENPYGNGYSSKTIVDILESIQIDEKLLVKDITF